MQDIQHQTVEKPKNGESEQMLQSITISANDQEIMLKTNVP